MLQYFKDEGLKLEVPNLPQPNFHHLTLSLSDGTFKLYRKPNDSSLKSKHSNTVHPPTVLTS